MKKGKNRILCFIVLVGLVLSTLGLSGCSESGKRGPDLEINGVKIDLDETKIDTLLNAGFTIKRGATTYSKDSRIPELTAIEGISLYVNEHSPGRVAIVNRMPKAAGAGDCVLYDVWMNFSVAREDSDKDRWMKNVSIEGVPLSDATPDVLIPKLEKKFGKKNVDTSNYTPNEVIDHELKTLGISDMDVTQRVAIVFCYGNKDRKGNIEWAITFDLITQKASMLTMKKNIS